MKQGVPRGIREIVAPKSQKSQQRGMGPKKGFANPPQDLLLSTRGHSLGDGLARGREEWLFVFLRHPRQEPADHVGQCKCLKVFFVHWESGRQPERAASLRETIASVTVTSANQQHYVRAGCFVMQQTRNAASQPESLIS